jgi:phosphoribosyl-AMP cyclohydrolase
MSNDTLTEATVGAVIDRANFSADGLIPAIIQQWDTREVLMLGYMNAEAMRRTLTEGRVTFWSRSRQEFWRKGDTSGNIQLVRGAALDCDSDALLVTVDQHGPACHTGAHACFDVDPLAPVVSAPDA